MPMIEFDHVTKRFGSSVAVDGFDAAIPDNEFLVLLGPSGCGKSTMLRMIAGLTDITSGELRFDGRRVNEVPPKLRNIAFVFQSYALYPHMSVRGNLSFPLVMSHFRSWNHVPVVNGIVKRRLMREPAIERRVAEVATMMELTELLERRPGTLSGGQRQRVALGRALVREPTLYLLDEPLSNLDAVLRNQMRAEITALYRNVGKSFIYVTHDQVEAMTMGTRIAVLNMGRVQQIGTPAEVFDRPANVFVAKFIGTPPMNLFEGVVEGKLLRLEGGAVTLPVSMRDVAVSGDRVLLGVRTEHLSIRPASSAARSGLRGHVVELEYLGADAMVGFRLGQSAGHAVVARDLAHARISLDSGLMPGSECEVTLELDGASLFDLGSGARLNP